MGIRNVSIDIGSTMVRVAEVELRGGSGEPRDGAMVHAVGEAKVPDGVVRDGYVEEPGALGTVIQEALSNAKISNKKVVVAVGNNSVVTRELDLPAQPMAEVRSSLAFHVADNLPIAADDALLDFYPTSELETADGGQLRGILVAAPKDTVNQVVGAVQKAGLQPIGVDHKGLALYRGVCKGSLVNGNVAMVDIGASGTTIVISQQGRPRLIRTLAQSGADASRAITAAARGTQVDAEALKRQIGMNHAHMGQYRAVVEAVEHAMTPLVESIRNTLVYFASSNAGGTVEHVVLTGGSAYLPGLGQAVATATRVGVSFGDPFQGLNLGKSLDTEIYKGQEAAYATAIGLAMGGIK